MRPPPATASALLTVSPEGRLHLVIPARGAADESELTPHDGTEGGHPTSSSHRLVDRRSELPSKLRTVSDVLVKMRNGTAAEARQSLLILSPEGDIQRISCSAVAFQRPSMLHISR